MSVESVSEDKLKQIAKRQRLQCDLGDFFREVLSWNLTDLQQIRESKETVYDSYESVPERFSSLAKYIKVMEPLLFAETRAHIFSAWREHGTPNQASITRALDPSLDKGKGGVNRAKTSTGKFMYLTVEFGGVQDHGLRPV